MIFARQKFRNAFHLFLLLPFFFLSVGNKYWMIISEIKINTPKALVDEVNAR